jgi:hypothetical protein
MTRTGLHILWRPNRIDARLAAGSGKQPLAAVSVFSASGKSGRGLTVERFLEDHQKRRLTEPVDILTAIEILRLQGCNEDELISEIMRIFYVDLDAYNEVVRAAA